MLSVKTDLQSTVYESYWIEDPSVDRTQSLVSEWIKTGEGLVALPQQEPSIIRWRGLTPRELRNVYQSTRGFLANQVVEYVRYGLIEISGLSLPSRQRIGGIPGHTEQTLDILSGFTAMLPVTLVTNVFLQAIQAEPIDQSEELESVSMIDWLGGLIASKTFRAS